MVRGGVVHAESIQPTDPSSGNDVTLNDSTYSVNGEGNSHSGTLEEVDGGYGSNGEASHNNVTVNGGTVTTFLNGGYLFGTGNTSYNRVLINGGTFNLWVEGGWATYGDANYNTVIINGGNFNNAIVDGGYTVRGNTNYNTINIHGGNFTYNGGSGISGIYGGYVAGSGDAKYNNVNIYGGTIAGPIYGGYTDSGTVQGNAVNIFGNPDLSAASIYAARSGSSVNALGNSLNFYTSGITAQNIGGFQYINFYMPDDYKKDTILTLTGGQVTDLGDLSTVGFGFSPNSNIRSGDVINLIHNTGNTIRLNDDVSVANFGADGTYHTKMSRGVSFDYDFDLAMSSDGHTLTGIVGSHGGLKEDDVAQIPISNPVPVFMISENPVINALHDMGGPDFDEDIEGDRAESPENVREVHGFEIFAHSGYGHLKTKTGKNSFVRTNNGNYDLGFARSLDMKEGTFVWAPIIEHSAGHYDAVLSDGRKGYGSAKYAAGGLIFRQINNSGFYFEGSARFGRSENDFISDHFKDAKGNFVRATYHTSAPIFAGHVRIGKALRLNKNNLLDVYGIYAYARQGGMNTELSTGDPYEFSSVSSSRVRVGYRLTTRTSKISRIYTGLAYQYESNSDAEAKTWDAEGAAWSLNAGSKGSSGMLELGWQIKPNKSNPWLLDINATGWVGHQKGATAMAKIQKSF